MPSMPRIGPTWRFTPSTSKARDSAVKRRSRAAAGVAAAAIRAEEAAIPVVAAEDIPAAVVAILAEAEDIPAAVVVRQAR